MGAGKQVFQVRIEGAGRIIAGNKNNITLHSYSTFLFTKKSFKNYFIGGTPLVVQWLRIRLPMQGTQVQSLVGELRSHMPRGN